MGWDIVLLIALATGLAVQYLATRRICRMVIDYATTDLELIREMRLLLQDLQSMRPEAEETIEAGLLDLNRQERKLRQLIVIAEPSRLLRRRRPSAGA